MIIEYYKEMSYEIDIPKLTKVFQDDIGVEKFNSEDVDDLITYFGDNTLYYLEKYGTITAHESWTQFYQELMETLDIPEHISNRKDSTTITIRICRREILQLLQDVITNNNLFYLKRKWNKLMIKEPSASES